MDAAVGLVTAYLESCGYYVLAELPVREAVGPHYRDVTDIDIVAVRFPHPPATELTDPFALLLGSDPELGWRGHGGNLDLAPCLESDR